MGVPREPQGGGAKGEGRGGGNGGQGVLARAGWAAGAGAGITGLGTASAQPRCLGAPLRDLGLESGKVGPWPPRTSCPSF